MSQIVIEKACFVCALLTFLLGLTLWGGDSKEDVTLTKAAAVLREMLSKEDVTPDLLAKADCILVLPEVKKFGIGIGGSGGRGAMTCRQGKDFHGPWSPPALYSIGGASIGLQVGGSSTDFVLLVMNQTGVDALVKGKTKLGRDASVAAGPSGATKSSVVGGSDMLSYARAQGLFVGMSLGGADIEPDDSANKKLYNTAITSHEILFGNSVRTPPAGEPLVSLLKSKVAKRGS